MFLRYKSIHKVPRVELRVEPMEREVGPENFWNMHNPVMTHVFNTLVILDRHCVEFLVQALQRVCDSEEGLPKNLIEHVELYIQHLLKNKQNRFEHVVLLRQLGYNDSIPDGYRFDRAFPIDTLSNHQLLAIANVYSWMTFCVSRFLLGKSWYLSSVASKPAMFMRWRWLMEEIHKGLLPALQDQLNVPFSVRQKAWWSVNWRGNRLFAHLFVKLLKTDGCFTLKQLPHTLRMLYKIFVSPRSGFYSLTWRFMRMYQKQKGNSIHISSERRIDDVLLNGHLYIAQTNPEVDNKAFFSGHYFRDLKEKAKR